MRTITQKILANPNPAANIQAGFNAAIGGRTLMIQGCDQGAVLTVTLVDGNGNSDTIQNIGAGAKLTPVIGFTSVQITTPVDANVTFIVTNGDIDVQLTQIGSTINNTNLNPVPVAIVSEPGAPFQVAAPVGQEVNVKVQGTVAVTGATLTATNVGINNTPANPVPVQLHASDDTTAIPVLDTKAQTPATVAPVAVLAGATGTAVLAADGTRRAVRFFNPASSAGPVALTPDNTTTYANAAIVLNPGDFWNETDAPGAAWYASTPATTGATINLQTVKP